MNKLLLLIGLSITSTVFANKIIINGEPLLLEHKGNSYNVPSNYENKMAYNFVMIDGKKRICYSDKQPNLNNLDVATINVSIDGKIVPWNCYNFDDTIFELIQ